MVSWPTLATGARFEASLPCGFINITLDIGEWIALYAVWLFTVFLRVVRKIGIFFFKDLVSQQESNRTVRVLMTKGRQEVSVLRGGRFYLRVHFIENSTGNSLAQLGLTLTTRVPF